MAVKVRDKNKIPELIDRLKGVNKSSMEVGILEDGEQAMIAHVHEYGLNIKVTPKMRAYLHYNGIHLKSSTTSINIPERSFVRKYANEQMDKDVKSLDPLIGELMHFGINETTFLEMVGEQLSDSMKDTLTDITSPPLSSVTVERKGSSKPLEDTGSLRDAIDYEVY